LRRKQGLDGIVAYKAKGIALETNRLIIVEKATEHAYYGNGTRKIGCMKKRRELGKEKSCLILPIEAQQIKYDFYRDAFYGNLFIEKSVY